MKPARRAPGPSPAESEARSGEPVKHELFERLCREGPRWSRNRNFELYERPGALVMLRRVLWLRQLERDLLRASVSEVRLRPVDDRFLLELEHRSLRLRRRVRLTAEELAVLRAGPAGAQLPGE